MAKKTEVERKVVNSALRVLELETIKSDPSYQREVSKYAVKKITKSFNHDAFGVPVVGEREDGSLWVVDGQQRLAALREMTDRDRKWVRCEVFASQGPEHEAEVFKIINNNRTKMRPYQIFWASLTAGDPLAWKMKKLVEEYGFRVMKGESPASKAEGETASKFVRAINFYMRILPLSEKHYCGEPAVRFVLNVLAEAWPGDSIKQKIEIAEGLQQFWSRHEGTVDVGRLLERLAKTPPTKLIYSASLGIGSRAANVADVLEKVYRRRKA